MTKSLSGAINYTIADCSSLVVAPKPCAILHRLRPKVSTLAHRPDVALTLSKAARPRSPSQRAPAPSDARDRKDKRRARRRLIGVTERPATRAPARSPRNPGDKRHRRRNRGLPENNGGVADHGAAAAGCADARHPDDEPARRWTGGTRQSRRVERCGRQAAGRAAPGAHGDFQHAIGRRRRSWWSPWPKAGASE